MLLNIDAITDKQTTIKGYTLAEADVIIKYETTESKTKADATGLFESKLTSTLPIGTTIHFLANVPNSFIYQEKNIQIVYSGDLTLDSAPQTIKFTMTPFQTNPAICPRSEDLILKVTDSRINSSNWKIYAKVDHNLTSKNGYVLTDSLIFIDNSGNITPLSNTPILVYTGENNNGTTKITDASWSTDKGILLRIANEPLENGEEYTANISWTLNE